MSEEKKEKLANEFSANDLDPAHKAALDTVIKNITEEKDIKAFLKTFDNINIEKADLFDKVFTTRDW